MSRIYSFLLEVSTKENKLFRNLPVLFQLINPLRGMLQRRQLDGCWNCPTVYRNNFFNFSGITFTLFPGSLGGKCRVFVIKRIKNDELSKFSQTVKECKLKEG